VESAKTNWCVRSLCVLSWLKFNHVGLIITTPNKATGKRSPQAPLYLTKCKPIPASVHESTSIQISSGNMYAPCLSNIQKRYAPPPNCTSHLPKAKHTSRPLLHTKAILKRAPDSPTSVACQNANAERESHNIPLAEICYMVPHTHRFIQDLCCFFGYADAHLHMRVGTFLLCVSHYTGITVR
jgi:hypothetical protein